MRRNENDIFIDVADIIPNCGNKPIKDAISRVIKPEMTAGAHLLLRIKRIRKTGAIQAAIQIGLSVLKIENENATRVTTRYSPFGIQFFFTIFALRVRMKNYILYV
jgi:hypothetical protein